MLPGFVDSPRPPGLRRRPGRGVRRPDGGPAYSAGGIRTTVAATRAATDDELRRQPGPARRRGARQGTTTVEIKRGYGLTVADEARACVAAELTDGDDLPRRARRARRVRRPAGGLRRPGDRRRCSTPARRTPAGSTSSASAAPSTPTRPARCCGPAGAPACCRGCTPTSSATGPGVQLAVELGAASADHCTYLTDDDVAALADSGTVATLLPGAEFSTRSPYPDARRLLDAGVTVALATDCNPGSCLHQLDAVLHRRWPCARCG